MSACITTGRTKIQVHPIYDYNQGERHKARMVVYVKITGPNLDTYYSSIISLCSICTVSFLDELNDMNICTSDISNDCLTARTTEYIVFNSGPEVVPFGHAGHLLMIKTALYVIKISGASLHSRLSDVLTTVGFVTSVVGCNIWIHDEGNY